MPTKKAADDMAKKAEKQELHTFTSYHNFDPALYKRVGHDVTLFGRALAGLVLLFLWITWIAGTFSIFWYPVIIYKGYYKAAVAVGLFLAYPYVVKVKQSPAFIRLLLIGSGWWRGGTTLLIEESLKKLDTSKNILLCMHPHGIMPMGFFLNGAAARVHARVPEKYVPLAYADMQPRSTGLVEPILFQIPLIRHFLQTFGCADPATKQRMKKLFEDGVSVGLLPGGSEEIILTERGREKIYIRKRKGFIKYALQYGYTILIGYTFGESDSYHTLTWGMQQRLAFLKKTKIPFFMGWGVWWCPLLPLTGLPLETVIGNPITLPKIDSPTPEDVEKWHAVYIDKLVDLFERNKSNFGYPNRQLELF